MTPTPEMDDPNEITHLLRRFAQGDSGAKDQLFSLIYNQLHRMAAYFLRRERPGHSLQPTALVNEAYLRMAGQCKLDFQSRAQFFGLAASVMRHILIDHARERRAQKRGAGKDPVTLDEALIASDKNLDTLLDLDEALDRLAKIDPRQAQIVEMRFYGGLTE